MIDAEVKGKLPEIHHLEDVFTSCYFGLIKYCSSDVLNRYFLSALKNLKDQQLEYYPQIVSLNFKIFFWPRLEDNSEPDLIIVLYDNNSKVEYLFFVEVKYYSQQNTYDTDEDFAAHFYENQLSREYTNLFSLDRIENFALKEDTKRFLVYLSADYSKPEGDFNRAINELRKNFDVQQICETMLWVNWYNLYDKLKESENEKGLLDFETNILEDLEKYLHRKNFWSFGGFGNFEEIAEATNFVFLQDENETSFNWQFEKTEELETKLVNFSMIIFDWKLEKVPLFQAVSKLCLIVHLGKKY